LSPYRARPVRDGRLVEIMAGPQSARRAIPRATASGCPIRTITTLTIYIALAMALIGPVTTCAAPASSEPGVDARQAQAQSQAIRRSLKELEQDLRKAQGQLSGTELALRDLEQSVAGKADAEQRLAAQVDRTQGVLEELKARHAEQRQRLEALEQGLSASIRLLHALSLTGFSTSDRRADLPYADWTGQLNRALAAELQAQQQLSVEYAYTRDALSGEQAPSRPPKRMSILIHMTRLSFPIPSVTNRSDSACARPA